MRMRMRMRMRRSQSGFSLDSVVGAACSPSEEPAGGEVNHHGLVALVLRREGIAVPLRAKTVARFLEVGILTIRERHKLAPFRRFRIPTFKNSLQVSFTNGL